MSGKLKAYMGTDHCPPDMPVGLDWTVSLMVGLFSLNTLFFFSSCFGTLVRIVPLYVPKGGYSMIYQLIHHIFFTGWAS